MSSNLSLKSHRPSPPESPPSDTKQYLTMNSHLPNTPQSPQPPSRPDASSTAYNMPGTDPNSDLSMDDIQASIRDGLGANPAEISNKKRKRETDDDGDQEQKKVHIESGTPGIEALHRDVGPPYRLASTPYPKALIDLTVDLFKVYSLEDIAKDVARGGENPKKMGKTYKKHMRLMKLSGKFDAVKKRENEVGLFDMLQVPDDEWNQMHGEKLQSGLDPSVRSNLAQAMTMSKGRIPKDRWDPSVLALTEPTVPVAAPKAVLNHNQKVPVQGTTLGQPRPPRISAEKARPQRANKKRSYTDDGYDGYGEGFADDGMTDDGPFRPGEEDTQPRRKKGSSGYHFQPAMRQGYGPGTVGA